MKQIWVSLRFLFLFSILLGLVYPLLVTGVGKLIFPTQTSGDFISKEGRVIGAKNIAQKFEKEIYFWSRPSAVDYNPLSSGGSNQGPTSADLKKSVAERTEKLKKAHPEQGEPPQDLIFASGSGLDPEISPDAAAYQSLRVARARGLDIAKVQTLIQNITTNRQWGFLGEPAVNVLKLNLALDELSSLAGGAGEH